MWEFSYCTETDANTGQQRTVVQWPPDLTSGPPTSVFYWPEMATEVQGSILIKNYSKIYIRGGIYK